MRRLVTFTMISLDGYFAAAEGDLGWAHRGDPEWKAYVEDNSRHGGGLVFGRLTYEMMASYWPTAHAAASDPVVAQNMNRLPKFVFSRTLTRPDWDSTRVLGRDLVADAGNLKSGNGADLVVLGSGSIVAQLAQAGLIDEFQLAVYPIILGKGQRLFPDLKDHLKLKLLRSRAFDNGNVVLVYQPAK
jgi:dihydrofolate reductase